MSPPAATGLVFHRTEGRTFVYGTDRFSQALYYVLYCSAKSCDASPVRSLLVPRNPRADEGKERVQARKEAPEMQCANMRGFVSVQREHREPVDVNVAHVLYGEFVIPENIPEQVHQE